MYKTNYHPPLMVAASGRGAIQTYPLSLFVGEGRLSVQNIAIDNEEYFRGICIIS
jgi:hypothetical protein